MCVCMYILLTILASYFHSHRHRYIFCNWIINEFAYIWYEINTNKMNTLKLCAFQAHFFSLSTLARMCDVNHRTRIVIAILRFFRNFIEYILLLERAKRWIQKCTRLDSTFQLNRRIQFIRWNEALTMWSFNLFWN